MVAHVTRDKRQLDDKDDEQSVSTDGNEITATGNSVSSRKSGSSEDSSGNELILGAKETVLVNRSKVFVLCFLLLAAAAVGMFTYRFTKSQDINNFEVSVSKQERKSGSSRGMK
jgi:hypothetical protein